MTNPLRQAILDYMWILFRSRPKTLKTPTWWFSCRFNGYDTRTIHRELVRMERDGLVKADRSQRNNTLWSLTDDQA